MAPPSPSPRLLPVVLLVATFGARGATAAPAGESAGDTRRLLALLAGVGGGGSGGGGARGGPPPPERGVRGQQAARRQPGRAHGGARRPPPPPGAGGARSGLGARGRALERGAPPASRGEQVEALSAAVTERTGIRDEPLPPQPPSAERGGALFAENCVGCHGARGDGAGEEAKRLGLAPAAVSPPALMRRETPRDFFNGISVGRRRSGMPEWAEAFTVQQRWDLVAHLWTLAHTQAAFSEGQALYASHCASCHGADGAGAGSEALALARPGSLVDQTDAQLLAV